MTLKELCTEAVAALEAGEPWGDVVVRVLLPRDSVLRNEALHIARQLTSDPHLAEDYASEALATVRRKLPGSSLQHHTVGQAGKFVRKAIENAIRDAAKSPRYRGLGTNTSHGIDEVIDSGPIPGMQNDEQDRQEKIADLHEAIYQLDDSCRELIAMKYFDGMRNIEIADEVGISGENDHKSKTVSDRIKSCCKKLRRLLQGWGGES